MVILLHLHRCHLKTSLGAGEGPNVLPPLLRRLHLVRRSPSRASSFAHERVFSEVGAMSLASQNRPFPLLDHLEGQGSRTVGRRGVEDGISSPLLITSPSLSGADFPAMLLPCLRQGGSSSWRGFGSFSQGSDRTSSPLSGILQPSFCCVEDRGVMEARDRSVLFERVCSPNSLQDGVQPLGFQCHSERRLDGFHRLEGCLPSRPITPGQLPVPSLCGGRGGLSVSSSLFWPLHGPPSLYQGHCSCISDASRHGCPDTLVSGRLADPSLLQVRGSVGEGPSFVPLQSPRHVINIAKSFLPPAQTATYLNIVVVSPSLRAFPSLESVSILLTQITEFLSYRWQDVVSWHCLLGCLSSLCHLVPGGRL